MLKNDINHIKKVISYNNSIIWLEKITHKKSFDKLKNN
jgi:hypothetical protein